ncbi:hypothetical protein V8J88_16065 [Massilia sp. W12]|uniref:hypothetical protein n=1 Tax=Massilia sp. W12 TaxID=3126507 RepID=UPI0030CAFFDC
MRVRIFVLACIVLFALTVWATWPQAPLAPLAQLPAPVPAAAPVAAPAAPPHAQAPAAAPDLRRVALLPTGPQMPAAQSLLETRDGDPRSPPIVRSELKQEQPSAEELADPKLYAKYEARQNLRVYASFIHATQQEIPKLQAGIERARREGIPEQKIAKIEHKIKRMQAMQEELLHTHPGLREMM